MKLLFNFLKAKQFRNCGKRILNLFIFYLFIYK